MGITKAVPTHEQIAAKPIKLKKILWTTDFSPASHASLPHAMALARRYESTLYLAQWWCRTRTRWCRRKRSPTLRISAGVTQLGWPPWLNLINSREFPRGPYGTR